MMSNEKLNLIDNNETNFTLVGDQDHLLVLSSQETLNVNCEPFWDKKIKSITIIQGEIEEDKKIKEIIFSEKFYDQIEELDIYWSGVENLDFLRFFNENLLKKIELRNNKIKTSKKEILSIVEKFKKLEKFDLSNELSLSNLNEVEDFESNKNLPKFVNIENCFPCKESLYSVKNQILLFRQYWSFIKKFENKNSRKIETPEERVVEINSGNLKSWKFTFFTFIPVFILMVWFVSKKKRSIKKKTK